MSAACLAAGDLGTPPAVTRGRLASCVCWQSGAPPYLRSCETETRSKCSGQNQTSDALRIFQLNVELDPDWANTYDRLGEACKAAGDKAQAVKNYEKSLSIPKIHRNVRSAAGEKAASKQYYPHGPKPFCPNQLRAWSHCRSGRKHGSHPQFRGLARKQWQRRPRER